VQVDLEALGADLEAKALVYLGLQMYQRVLEVRLEVAMAAVALEQQTTVKQ
jgi:hypothetical protein